MLFRILRKLDYWIGSFSEHLLLVCGILILLMAFLATFGVIMRRVFENPEPYSYEFSYMFLLLSGVLAIAGVEKLDQHVRNDLLASRFPQTMKMVISIISPLLAMTFCTVLIWKSMDNAIYSLTIGQTSQSTWRIPIAPIKFLIPSGFILLELILFSKLIKGINLLRGGRGSEETPDTS